MLKNILFQQRTIINVLCLALITFLSPISLSAGHFEWDPSGAGGDEPIDIFGHSEFFSWGARFTPDSSSSVSGSTFYWYGSVYASAEVNSSNSEFDHQTISGGNTLAASGSLYQDITATWVPIDYPEDEPESAPTTVSVLMSVQGDGYIYASTHYLQDVGVEPYVDGGDIIWVIAGAGASVGGSAWPGPSFSATTQGGITNGLPGGDIDGDAQISGVDIISNDSGAGSDTIAGIEGTYWYSSISFSIFYSDEYGPIVGGDSIAISPNLNAGATADLSVQTEETNWERVSFDAGAEAFVRLNISYSVYPY